MVMDVVGAGGEGMCGGRGSWVDQSINQSIRRWIMIDHVKRKIVGPAPIEVDIPVPRGQWRVDIEPYDVGKQLGE